MNNKIKNIIFDLGNVILKATPSIVLNNINITDEQKQNIKNTFFSNWDELDLGNETIEEHFNKSGISDNLKNDVKEILINYYKYRAFNTEIIELIKRLKGNNYKIYILSNNNKEAYKYLHNLPLFECVDGWIVSCDYHINKPDERLYQILFENYMLNPKECFFIDDKKLNIEAGKLLGMNGHILNFEKYGIIELVRDLEENGIKI